MFKESTSDDRDWSYLLSERLFALLYDLIDVPFQDGRHAA